MLEIDEVGENLHFLEASGLHFGPHFWTSGRHFGSLFEAWTPTWDPFWHFGGPGCQNGRFWGSLWAPPGVHFGHILGTKSQKKLQKHEKLGVWKRSLKKAEKQHFTNRVWRGPERHPIDACRTFREVRRDALGVILGGLLGHFWSYFGHFWGSGPQLGLPKQVPKGDLEIR